MKQKLVAFTGAGISAESGLKTFRDMDGLWESYDINEVATPAAWEANPSLVLEFYNMRRRQIVDAQPNKAHEVLVELEKDFDVHIITQNIDDLHERAGSTKVLHLHGEILQSRSSTDETKVYQVDGPDIHMGDVCELGSQLRPNIVWFGEPVPMMENAFKIASGSDIFCVIGTSLAVYPAAGIVDYIDKAIPKYIVDPGEINLSNVSNTEHIKEKASIGLPILASKLSM